MAKRILLTTRTRWQPPGQKFAAVDHFWFAFPTTRKLTRNLANKLAKEAQERENHEAFVRQVQPSAFKATSSADLPRIYRSNGLWHWLFG
jgi:hypothetical protein